MSRASSLYRLQQIDTSLDRARARVGDIETLLADSSAIVQARDALERAERMLAETRANMSSAEGLVAAQRQKIKETEQKLYGGTVQNPKELQDLQMESESLKRHLATLEDRLLEAMLELDDVRGAQEAARGLLEKVEAVQASENADLVEERAKIGADVRRLEEERAAVVAGIPADDLGLYTKLRASSGGVAVTLLENGSCGVCGLTHTAATQQAVRAGGDLVRCTQCGRILYGG